MGQTSGNACNDHVAGMAMVALIMVLRVRIDDPDDNDDNDDDGGGIDAGECHFLIRYASSRLHV